MELLAEAQRRHRALDVEELEKAAEYLDVPAYRFSHGAASYYIMPLRELDDVLATSIELIRWRFGSAGGAEHTTAAEPAGVNDVDELLRRAGAALSAGLVDDAAKYYAALERTGIAERHAALNAAVLALARRDLPAARHHLARYEAVTGSPTERFILATLRGLADALAGEPVDVSEIERLRAGIQGFIPARSPVLPLARCLRCEGAPPGVEGILRAHGL